MERKMKHHYDEESDSLYIEIKKGEEEKFEEVFPGINVELNDKDEIIGIEILKVSRLKKEVVMKN